MVAKSITQYPKTSYNTSGEKYDLSSKTGYITRPFVIWLESSFVTPLNVKKWCDNYDKPDYVKTEETGFYWQPFKPDRLYNISVTMDFMSMTIVSSHPFCEPYPAFINVTCETSKTVYIMNMTIAKQSKCTP